MAGKRAALAEATAERVLKAARAVFQAAGYERTTMRDIAQAAGLSTGAIFCHWPGKRALHDALLARFADVRISYTIHLRDELERVETMSWDAADDLSPFGDHPQCLT